FGEEDSFGLDLAEQSKLCKLDASFENRSPLFSKKWKHVHFQLSSDCVDIACQTDSTPLPNIL
ncbi:hypothetical protein SK128_027077, partial [Halocaridina rubra]